MLISAPGKECDATIVYGVNHQQLKASDTIVSNASCTTNCLAPLVKPLHDKLGVISGLMNNLVLKLSESYQKSLAVNSEKLTDL